MIFEKHVLLKKCKFLLNLSRSSWAGAGPIWAHTGPYGPLLGPYGPEKSKKIGKTSAL